MAYNIKNDFFCLKRGCLFQNAPEEQGSLNQFIWVVPFVYHSYTHTITFLELGMYVYVNFDGKVPTLPHASLRVQFSDKRKVAPQFL